MKRRKAKSANKTKECDLKIKRFTYNNVINITKEENKNTLSENNPSKKDEK